eukprot:jgi/Botrbrau1/7233/Bobra.0021s0017.1
MEVSLWNTSGSGFGGSALDPLMHDEVSQRPELEGFVDADYVGDLEQIYFTTGYVVSVYGSAVVWGRKKQSSVSNSKVAAEYSD